MKKYIPVLVLAVVILVAILIIGECASSSKIKALEEKYQVGKKELESQIAESEKNRLALGLKIKEKDRLISKFELEIESGKEKIEKLTKDIKNLPWYKVTAANCKQKYNELYTDYDLRGEKIKELEKQLKLFDRMVKEMAAKFQLKENQYQAAIKEIALYRMRVDSCEKLLDTYRKKRGKLFSFVLGGGITTTGHIAAGLFFGVDPIATWQRVF